MIGDATQIADLGTRGAETTPCAQLSPCDMRSCSLRPSHNGSTDDNVATHALSDAPLGVPSVGSRLAART
jgi:hypothetical protein